MCGRYTLLAEEAEILKEFGISQSIDGYEPRYNIAPGQQVLAVIHDGKEKRAGYMKWGLVPSWAKDPKIGYKMINARSETAHEKPSYRKLMSRKRCLIAADSFYEWKQTESGKQPLRIQTENRPLFAFAGLWDQWKGDDAPLYTCTILTREANEDVAPVHDRMPVILPRDRQDDWITPVQWEARQAKDYLDELTMDELTMYEVSTHVNSAKNEDEACIRPLA